MSEVLRSIKWARDTIRDRLMFGMEKNPLSAAYARERRASGVLQDCARKIRKLENQIKTLKRALKKYEEVRSFYGDGDKSEEEWIKDCSYYDPKPPLRRTVYVIGKKARELLKDSDVIKAREMIR